MILRLCVLWVILGCLSVAISSAADRVIDPAVLDRLRNQAAQDWQDMEREFRSVDVTYGFTVKEGQQEHLKLISKQIFRIACDIDRNLTLLRTQRDGYPGLMNHQLANPRYTFEVSCPDETSRGTLVLLNIASKSDYPFEQGIPDWYCLQSNLLAACRMSCMRASEVFDLSEFKPIEAIELIEDDHPRIRFSAKYLGENRHLRVKGAEYSITVDPEHLHRILIWEVAAPASIRYAYHIKYHNDKLHFPHEIVYTIDTGKNRSEQTWTYDFPRPCTIPDAEFYLPHYGFSESVLETLHPNPWPRWLLIGFGIVTIAIGAWLVRGRRQPAA